LKKKKNELVVFPLFCLNPLFNFRPCLRRVFAVKGGIFTKFLTFQESIKIREKEGLKRS